MPIRVNLRLYCKILSLVVSGVTCRNTRALRKGKKSKVRVVVQSLRKGHMGNANGIDSEGVTSNWGS